MIPQSHKIELENFIRCWNIYSGLTYRSDYRVDCRMKAVDTYAKMCVELGAKRLTVTDDLYIEPDYYPIIGKNRFDYVIGFTAYLFNNELGMINDMRINGNRLYLSTKKMSLCVVMDDYISTEGEDETPKE